MEITLRLKNREIVEVKSLHFDDRYGRMVTVSDIDSPKELIINGIEHKIGIIKTEPIIDGWATHDFYFVDWDEKFMQSVKEFLINLNLFHENIPLVNVAKSFKEIIEFHVEARYKKLHELY